MSMLCRAGPRCLSRRQALVPCARFFSTTFVKRQATPVHDDENAFVIRYVKAGPPPEQTTIEEAMANGVATKAKANGKATKARLVEAERARTILTSDPKNTTLQQLLDCIPALAPGSMLPSRATVVLLVTPSYAASLGSQQDLIHATLNRIYPFDNTATARGKVQLVAAVVDRLPRPSSTHNNHAGDEGLAFMFNDRTYDLSKDGHLSPGEPGSALSDTSRANLRTINFHSFVAEDLMYSAQLPLANTIFHNGLPSTMFRWRYARESGVLVPQSTRPIVDGFHAVLPYYNISKSAYTLSLPLLPLTPVRSIVACMGNIVRRLSSTTGLRSPPRGEEPILASQELEASVSSYFKARDLPPQAVSVWALIIPYHSFLVRLSSVADDVNTTDLDKTWKGATDSSGPNLHFLLRNGARLHKVLSGGGGWGKKAGLLALDPDSDYNPLVSTYEPNADTASQSLQEIVKPGDHLQFYISTASHPFHTATTADSDVDSHVIDFGTIPSTVDDMPVSQENNAAASKIEQFPDYFGALSETGLALLFRHEKNGIHLTKVDVPFGRYRARHFSPRKSNEAQTGQAFKPTQPLSYTLTSQCMYRENV